MSRHQPGLNNFDNFVGQVQELFVDYLTTVKLSLEKLGQTYIRKWFHTRLGAGHAFIFQFTRLAECERAFCKPVM
jgi:hypothetical protein